MHEAKTAQRPRRCLGRAFCDLLLCMAFLYLSKLVLMRVSRRQIRRSLRRAEVNVCICDAENPEIHAHHNTIHDPRAPDAMHRDSAAVYALV
jgi:hypothetical protein